MKWRRKTLDLLFFFYSLFLSSNNNNNNNNKKDAKPRNYAKYLQQKKKETKNKTKHWRSDERTNNKNKQNKHGVGFPAAAAVVDVASTNRNVSAHWRSMMKSFSILPNGESNQTKKNSVTSQVKLGRTRRHRYIRLHCL